ncbi:MAG TPA: alpha/beta hydrolase [Planctomycetota bacterium]|nr:alpha/beta hydrolase [Planctomycetota bacterium]
MPFNTALRFLRRPWGKQAWRLRPSTAVDPAPAPLVIFLHGLGGDQEDWRALVEQLPTAWTMILLDFRGHGRSGSPEEGFELDDLARDVLDLLHAIGPGDEPVHLLGYGVGGMVALRAAALAAEGRSDTGGSHRSIRGLVLIETFSSQRAAGAFRPGRFVAKLAAEHRRKISAKYYATRERFHVAAYDQFWASVIRFDARPFLGTTPLPVHILYGATGRHAATPRKLELPNRPNLHLHWVEKTGHYLLHEKPVETAAICRRAIERVRLPDTPGAN